MIVANTARTWCWWFCCLPDWRTGQGGDGMTEDEIMARRTKNGGWTRETLAEWGVPWPPPKGWKRTLIDATETDGNREGDSDGEMPTP